MVFISALHDYRNTTAKWTCGHKQLKKKLIWYFSYFYSEHIYQYCGCNLHRWGRYLDYWQWICHDYTCMCYWVINILNNTVHNNWTTKLHYNYCATVNIFLRSVYLSCMHALLTKIQIIYHEMIMQPLVSQHIVKLSISRQINAKFP